MKASDIFEALHALPVLSLESALRPGPLVIVAPHADDESLGCGGLIAQAVMSGRSVELVFLTDGAASHPRSSAYPAARLRDAREGEARQAAAVLGVEADRLTFLRLPDGSAPTSGPLADEAKERLVQLLDRTGASSIFVTWWGDPHGDHAAAFALAMACAQLAFGKPQLFAYLVWGWSLPGNAELPLHNIRGFRLDVSKELPLKRQAIAQHATQITALISDDPKGFRLTEADINRCCGPFEIFIREHDDA